ncbi:hypothetical protein B0T09DRAFT_127484 [Sordaria sp. MPI-SDFR-AT-0083]|nr:hypothetical protein B0T09DRAFT_127484 [Sordaria sp. MPI-SDFR-AT-0083]
MHVLYIVRNTVLHLFAMVLQKSHDDLFSFLIARYFILYQSLPCPPRAVQGVTRCVCPPWLFYLTQKPPRTLRRRRGLEDNSNPGRYDPFRHFTVTQRPGTRANQTSLVGSIVYRLAGTDLNSARPEYDQVELDVSCQQAVQHHPLDRGRLPGEIPRQEEESQRSSSAILQ